MEHTDPRPGPGHERNDVSTRGIVRFLVGLAVSAVVIQLGIWGMFRILARPSRSEDRPLTPSVARAMKRLPPAPRLEDRPLAPRTKLNAQENARLTTYGWVDRNAGTVHIPIDRAMELLSQRGLPEKGGPPAATAAAIPPAGGAAKK
ncbi:MAG: hypothetical protein LC796_06795 [Acidobacteria bacterium]|nr:hypothetical protein [Acidobacteriota bacterium]MCA1609817.1 hypothetical protein [Acidobacteriota bacterium]